jgi:hypothetical protein
MAAGAVSFAQYANAATEFSANFEDSNIGSWSKSGGTWAVVTDGSKAVQQSSAGSANARLFNASASLTNYTVQARVRPLSLGSGSLVGLLARASGSTTFYRLALLPGNRVELQAVNSGSMAVIGSASRTITVGSWYTLSVTTNGTTISGSVDGTQIASGSSSVVASGRIGLQTLLASASFDDVVVTSGATTPPTTPGSTTRPPTTPPTTTAPPPSGGTPTGAWPTPSGQAPVSNGTIPVSGVFDGGMQRFCCIGDGGQGESQDPVFELAAGATIKNVILGAPAGDGIHCLGNCTIQNVWWEDVGEDAATFLGGTDYFVVGGGARHASDKVFQHNGPGTVHISGFYVEDAGKLYRACGNCSSSFTRHVVVDNILVRTTGVVAGININWGDTAHFTRIHVVGSSTICDKYNGVPKGSEPTHVGSGADGVNCFYSPSDIIFQ